MRTLNTLLALRTFSTANRFIYFAQRLPLIGKHIKDSAYANLGGKKIVNIIAILLGVLWGLISKLAYIGLLVYLPAVALSGVTNQEEQLQLFLHLFMIVIFIVASVSSASILEPKREKYIAVKLMRMQPTTYMRVSLSYKYCTYLIYYIPALLIFTSLLGATILQALSLAVSITLWRVLSEYLHLKWFEKTGKVLIKNNLIVWLTIGIGYSVAYAPLFLDWIPVSGTLLLSVPVMLVIAALGIYAAIQLYRYQDYRTVVDTATKRDDPLLDLGRMISEAQQTAVRSKDSDFASVAQQSDQFKNKEGYTYLNALFFARHRSLILQPVYKRLMIIGALGVIGIVLALTGNPLIAIMISNLDRVLPFLVFTLSLISVGEAMCRVIFFNCDLSLLRYSFYRNAVNSHFRIRLYRITGLNLTISAALGMALTLIVLVGGGAPVLDLLLMWVCVLTLAVFFSVHHLLMYYIFQPYSTELNMKNPFFFIVTMVVSAATGLCIIVQAPALTFTLIILILTLVYLPTALILVHKFGQRTFRVK